MEVYEMVELQDCPHCGGTGWLEDEGTNGVYVVCGDCGGQTVVINYTVDKLAAAKKVEDLWNSGKVITSERGE